MQVELGSSRRICVRGGKPDPLIFRAWDWSNRSQSQNQIWAHCSSLTQSQMRLGLTKLRFSVLSLMRLPPLSHTLLQEGQRVSFWGPLSPSLGNMCHGSHINLLLPSLMGPLLQWKFSSRCTRPHKRGGWPGERTVPRETSVRFHTWMGSIVMPHLGNRKARQSKYNMWVGQSVTYM